ncbi:MAG: hypothetical protein ABSF26_15105 [Thermoguttaceae bacterium]|jgi:hypothetical protein
MKASFITFCLTLPLSANTSDAQAKTVWANPKHDEKGNLLPLQSCGETINRAMKFILEDQATWAKGNKITDEDGKIRPPYFFYCVAIDGQLDGAGAPVSRNTNYPAFHHAFFIHAFLDYYIYSGNEESLRRAEELAVWNISHSTPLDWKYGGLPYSTVHNGKVGGSVDADAIMTDKPAIMAGAYLRLHRTTQKPEYLRAAEQIADTLTRTQMPQGNWPFRVNPKTGEVREEYTSSVIYAVELFEQLDALTEQKRYAEPRAKALQWLLKGPVQSMNWNGFYEDVSKDMGRNNRTNWDCIDTACYLVRHRVENKSYLPLAIQLHDWVKKMFVDEKHRYGPAHAVREQLVCNCRMAGHSGHWASLLGSLYQATGEEKYRTAQVNVASLITYHLQPDNRISLGPEWDESQFGYWYSAQFSCTHWLIDIFGQVPETAPDGENHLLRASAVVQAIRYESNKVAYTTDGSSSDVLKLSFRPEEIAVNGQPLAAGDGVGKGWRFDPKTRVLRLVHEAGKVVIR